MPPCRCWPTAGTPCCNRIIAGQSGTGRSSSAPDPKRIGIAGFSYGGYATLAGLAFTPELYAAGFDAVGISNLIAFLNSFPPYWEAEREFWAKHLGDVNKPDDRKRLMEQSPINSVSKIRAPLFVVQGANDPRVTKAESEQIVTALRDQGKSVEYMCAPDEGHWFDGREVSRPPTTRSPPPHAASPSPLAVDGWRFLPGSTRSAISSAIDPQQLPTRPEGFVSATDQPQSISV